MKIKEISNKKLFKEYLLTIPYKEIDNEINNKINEIIPTVSLPGFRKGKAPINIVRKKYENNILNEVIDKIANNKTKELLDKEKLNVFRSPKVELKKYVINEDIELGIKIDIQPEIKISNFDKIKTNKYEIKIDKKSEDENYNNYLLSQQTYKKIEENRIIKKSDKIFVTISTEDKSAPDFMQHQENIPIITDSDYQILPDISDKIINKSLKAGEETKLQFDLKEILKSKTKKIIEFQIKINSVEEKIPFKVDKIFLDKHNLKSESELKNKIQENLKKQYESYLNEIEKKELMDILEEKHVFDLPEGILEEEFEIIWKRVEKAKEEKKLDEDDKKLSNEKLRERYLTIASRRVKLALLIQHIAKENNLSVDEKELTQGMIEYASQYPGQEKQIFDYFKKNPQSIETVRGPLFERKIINFILSKTTKQNKALSIKDFNKLQEETFSLKRKK